MSSISVTGSRGAESSEAINRGENKNKLFSKIVRVALATIGILASYTFLPPVGATILSSIIIIVTIMSFYESIGSSFRSPRVIINPPEDPPIVINPWRRRFAFLNPNRLFSSLHQVTTPLTATRRATVRQSQSAATSRVPVGTRGKTPTSAPSSHWSLFSPHPQPATDPSARQAERVRNDVGTERVPVGRGKARAASQGAETPASLSARENKRIIPGSRK